MSYSRIAFKLLLILSLWPFSAHSSDLGIIRFSCSVNANSDHFRYFNQLYSHAFKQLGYQFHMQSLPPLRELSHLRDRKIDGVCARTDGILATPDTSTLVRVDEVVAKSHMVIYGARPTITVEASNLRSFQKYHVGYRRGYLGLADSLKNAGLAQLHAIDRPVHGVRQLASGRIDIYIDQHIAIVGVLKQHPTLEERVHNLGSYKKRNVFAYLVPHHAALAQPLAKALKKSKETIPLPRLSLPIDD